MNTSVQRPVSTALNGDTAFALSSLELSGEAPRVGQHVTGRSFILGLLLAAILSGVNAWLETQINSHFLGGVQLPCGAIFGLLLMTVGVNGLLRLFNRSVRGRLAPFTPVELLTIYAMLLFAALISTAGTDNFFLTTSPTLFYFSSRENQWAELFYHYVPGHFAPGWDGRTYQREVIEPFFTGGVPFNAIPWHAWAVMLLAWSVLLLLAYSTLFFISLLLRRQWIENEALSFPLVQLPLQMVEAGDGPLMGQGFWKNQTMWGGFALAGTFHLLRGLNYYWPDFPAIGAFQGNAFLIRFTEQPWKAVGVVDIQFFFGAIGIAYLLTRELSFSFWFFFLLLKAQYVLATVMGYPPASLPRDTYLGNPVFITLQSTGGWLMMGALLLWSARGHFQRMGRAALRNEHLEGEPFSARFVLAGLILSASGIMAWCLYSGINPTAVAAFFGLYVLVSIILARLVVEGGYLFPQMTFAPLETLTNSVLGSGLIGASSLTKLSFMQPMLFADMRSNLLPGFLHTLKIAHDLRLDRRNTRRLLAAVAAAIVLSMLVSTVVSLSCIYKAGGLTGYTWFTQDGPKDVFKGTANMLRSQPGVQYTNWLWMGGGAGVVWLLTLARARFLWFPLHPLAFIVASGFPITQLWPSFFAGWLTKTLLLKYGGNDAVTRARPFMIGLILGNASAMVGWMLFGFWRGVQITYWPA